MDFEPPRRAAAVAVIHLAAAEVGENFVIAMFVHRHNETRRQRGAIHRAKRAEARAGPHPADAKRAVRTAGPERRGLMQDHAWETVDGFVSGQGCTFTAPVRKSLSINGAGEGNRTLVCMKVKILVLGGIIWWWFTREM